MRLAEQGFEFVDEFDGMEMLRKIEKAARLCYQSEPSGDDEVTKKFVKGLISRGHESTIEHASITVKITTDRGVTHAIVRHRIASFSQSSTIYCKFNSGKPGKDMTFIQPVQWSDGDPQFAVWMTCMQQCEDAYNRLIEMGAKPSEARSVLPNSLKAELAMTMNLRSWRHFFRLRTEGPGDADQMVQLARSMLRAFREKVPVIFDDVGKVE